MTAPRARQPRLGRAAGAGLHSFTIMFMASVPRMTGFWRSVTHSSTTCTVGRHAGSLSTQRR
jgi:hypothetical protein